jgi:hypothetical protein
MGFIVHHLGRFGRWWLFPPMAQQPVVDHGLLTTEASRSQLHTPHLVGLPWTSDQPDAEASSWQHTTFTSDRHPCPQRDSNPQSQQVSGRRPTPQTARGLDRLILIQTVFNSSLSTSQRTSSFCYKDEGVTLYTEAVFHEKKNVMAQLLGIRFVSSAVFTVMWTL